MQILYQISLSQPAWVNQSTSAGCFFQAQWQAVQAVLGHNEDLANKDKFDVHYLDRGQLNNLQVLKLIVDFASKSVLTNMTCYPPAVMKLKLMYY